jgi:hypothetical protein
MELFGVKERQYVGVSHGCQTGACTVHHVQDTGQALSS